MHLARARCSSLIALVLRCSGDEQVGTLAKLEKNNAGGWWSWCCCGVVVVCRGCCHLLVWLLLNACF
jgi:hypothetical protein